MNTKPLPPELIALLSGVMPGLTGAVFIEIKPREGQSFEEAIAEAEAEHRKECAECAAEHAAEQAAAKVRDEFEAKAQQHGATGATPEAETRKASAPRDENTAGTDRTPVGYMLFIRKPGSNEKARPMPSSFRPTYSAVAELAVKFEQTPAYLMLNMFGATPVIDVKPVYAD